MLYYRCGKNMTSWWFLFPSGMKINLKRPSRYPQPHLQQGAEPLLPSLSGKSQASAALWVFAKFSSSSKQSDPISRHIAHLMDGPNPGKQENSILTILLKFRDCWSSGKAPFAVEPSISVGFWISSECPEWVTRKCLLWLSDRISIIPCHQRLSNPSFCDPNPREREGKQNEGISTWEQMDSITPETWKFSYLQS